MQQLDDVAGGFIFTIGSIFIAERIDKKILKLQSDHRRDMNKRPEIRKEINSLKRAKGAAVVIGFLFDATFITALTVLPEKSNNNSDKSSNGNTDNPDNLNEVATYDSSAYNGIY